MTEAQKQFEESRREAFNVFLAEWTETSPIMNNMHVSDAAKIVAVEAVKEVFYAGFGAAYASYVLLLLAAGRKPSEEK